MRVPNLNEYMGTTNMLLGWLNRLSLSDSLLESTPHRMTGTGWSRCTPRVEAILIMTRANFTTIINRRSRVREDRPSMDERQGGILPEPPTNSITRKSNSFIQFISNRVESLLTSTLERAPGRGYQSRGTNLGFSIPVHSSTKRAENPQMIDCGHFQTGGISVPTPRGENRKAEYPEKGQLV